MGPCALTYRRNQVSCLAFATMAMARSPSMIGVIGRPCIGRSDAGRVDHRVVSRERPMNDQSESTHRVLSSVSQVNGSKPDPGIAAVNINVGHAEMFPQSICDNADHLRLWPLLSSSQDPGGQGGQNNEFMTVFSHELRNSLGAIRSATRILSIDPSAGPPAVKARAMIERQVEQMTRLVEDLLDASRVRSGQLHLRCERVDLRAVVAHAAQTIEFTMQQQNHKMATSFSEAPIWLQADAARLEQVFVNLLSNAAKYTDAGGSVELSVGRDKGEAIVRIRDSGIGISPEVLPHVFDLFVQADPSSRRGNAGLGIGLALVRNLIERHGGFVTVASAGLGHGSEFTVRLPIPMA
jgi:two-component sensor histidine kinase